jgi:hypothetical protein
MSELQIDQDVEFQRREWRMERMGWVALAGFVIAAAAGVFGDGPLSRASASDDSGQLVIRYERFLRASASSELHLQVVASTANNGELTIWADPSYLRHIEVLSVVPEPKRVEQLGPHIAYVFAITAAAESAEIAFRYKPTRAGRLHGSFGVSKEAPVALRQFAFF